MPLMNKSLTTKNGWLTAEGLRSGHRESFTVGRSFVTMRIVSLMIAPERIVVMADLSNQLYRDEFRVEQLNQARKRFVERCRQMDSTYKHEPVKV